jgi:hypothetical protein
LSADDDEEAAVAVEEEVEEEADDDEEAAVAVEEAEEVEEEADEEDEEEVEEEKLADHLFKDYKEYIDTDYAPYIATAKELGLTTGYEDDTFRFDRLVTREEMATFIFRTLNYMKIEIGDAGELEADDFDDIDDVQDWAKDAVEAMIAGGIMVGVSSDELEFDPKGKSFRATMAIMIYRLLDGKDIIEADEVVCTCEEKADDKVDEAEKAEEDDEDDDEDDEDDEEAEEDDEDDEDDEEAEEE